MELTNELVEEKKELNLNNEKNKINLEKDSIQYNCQDLDQEQKVDVNPVQLNTQNLHLLIKNDTNYSGKITGNSCLERDKEIAANVDIFLFFGHESKQPVYKTNSDNNGNFVIDDIPPGYYTLFAQSGANLKYRSSFIKVLPCQIVHHQIQLSNRMINMG